MYTLHVIRFKAHVNFMKAILPAQNNGASPMDNSIREIKTK